MQWKAKQDWEKYLENRENSPQSSFQKILLRCRDIATSPIYDTMQETTSENYILENGIEMKFTDKTAIFCIPIKEFADIPRKEDAPVESPIAFLRIAFTLPEYAHERKRFFRKGGTVQEFARYVERLDSALSEKQQKFLNDLVESSTLRIYREVLELPDTNEVGGYFLNISKGYDKFSKSYLESCIQDFFKKQKNIVIREVTRLQTWFSDWMRKIGGFIIEEKAGRRINIAKPLQISVDGRLSAHAFKKELKFMPSPGLKKSVTYATNEDWQKAFVSELRTTYQSTPKLFHKYANGVQSGKIQIKCACKQNHTEHQNETEHDERCPVPTIHTILEKIRASKPNTTG